MTDPRRPGRLRVLLRYLAGLAVLLLSAAVSVAVLAAVFAFLTGRL